MGKGIKIKWLNTKHEKVVKEVLKIGLDKMNQSDLDTALKLVGKNGHTIYVEMLLEAGAKPPAIKKQC